MGQAVEVRELALVLPLPPSINHQYATVHGRRVLSRAGRVYKALVAEEVELWRDQHHLSDEALILFQRHYLALSITFYFVTARRRDLDGGLKIAQDALCEALGTNDNLVVEIYLRKRVDPQSPRAELCLTALPLASVDLHQGAGEMPALPARLDPNQKRRRRLRRRRSFEELAVRYKWE